MCLASGLLLAAMGIAPACLASEFHFESEAGLAAGQIGASGSRTKSTDFAFSRESLLAAVGDRIFFAAHQSEIKAELAIVLDRLVAWLNDYPEQLITIEGHADEPGTEAYNQLLSEERAEAVLDYLFAKGIALDRVRAVGYGRKRPAVLGGGEGAQAQNRRVEFVSDGPALE